MPAKRLYRSATDKKVCGVCAGIAEYFKIDPTLIRLLWVLFSLTSAGVIAYIIAAIVIPEEPLTDNGIITPADSSEDKFNNYN